jgi:MATE family multidrug resistance protein
MLLGFSAFWGAGLLSSYMLGFSFGLGSVGLLIGEVIGIATAAGFFIWRFRQLISKYTAVVKDETRTKSLET